PDWIPIVHLCTSGQGASGNARTSPKISEGILTGAKSISRCAHLGRIDSCSWRGAVVTRSRGYDGSSSVMVLAFQGASVMKLFHGTLFVALSSLSFALVACGGHV